MDMEPQKRFIVSLHEMIKEEDPDLARIIVEQKGSEASYRHLRENKGNLDTHNGVFAWINAAILTARLTGSGHDGITLLHRVYESMLELAEAKKELPIASGDMLWHLGTLYLEQNYQRASERYYTLALCSDIISGHSTEQLKNLGAYPALTARHRHSENRINQWADQAIIKYSIDLYTTD
jgi:hypothetical protein